MLILFLNEDTNNRFFIMPGLRGVGKTTILFQLYDYLYEKEGISSNQILYLNLDRLKDMDFDLQEYLDTFIFSINEENYRNNEPLFIFVDESQYSNNWGLIGKIIFDETNKVFIIFTGSGALNLESNNDYARRALKKQVYPLNFQEYLNLKYGLKSPKNLTHEFYKLIFTGECDELIKMEKDIQLNSFMKIERDLDMEWDDYIQYKELPFSINLEAEETISLTLDMKNRVIEKDMDIVSSFTSSTRLTSYKLLNIIAMQKPSELSLNKLSSILDLSIKSINNLLGAFEDTQLIFHIEPYGSITKRVKKSWEYYFL